MSDITVHRAYVEQSNYLLYYTSVVSGIIKNGLNPKAVKQGLLYSREHKEEDVMLAAYWAGHYRPGVSCLT